MITRRSLLKTSLLVPVIALTERRDALASKIWCRGDPIITYNDGMKIRVVVSIPAEFEELVNGHTKIDIGCTDDLYPVKTKLLPGFNGFSEVVEITEDYHHYEVLVPAAGNFPVLVDMTINGGTMIANGDYHYEGVSNSWISLD